MKKIVAGISSSVMVTVDSNMIREDVENRAFVSLVPVATLCDSDTFNSNSAEIPVAEKASPEVVEQYLSLWRALERLLDKIQSMKEWSNQDVLDSVVSRRRPHRIESERQREDAKCIGICGCMCVLVCGAVLVVMLVLNKKEFG